MKQKYEADLDKVKVYNAIRGNMSLESVERVESDADFTLKNVRANQDPLELWRIIKKTHVRGRTGVDKLDRASANEEYHNLKMRSGESLPEFKLRLERAIRAREFVELPVINEETQALDFILKTDDARFAEMRKELVRRESVIDDEYCEL